MEAEARPQRAELTGLLSAEEARTIADDEGLELTR